MYETPWKVVGFEKFVTETGDDCVRLYLARPLSVPEGNTGEGLEVQRKFWKLRYAKFKYEPRCCDMVIVIDNPRYPGSVDNVIVVGRDETR